MGSDPLVSSNQKRRIHLNPRSPDGERRHHVGGGACAHPISIHAPRMGSDQQGGYSGTAQQLFQSTLPGWGATVMLIFPVVPYRYFNPRSPDGERLGQTIPVVSAVTHFNPRSPDGERLTRFTTNLTAWSYFNPRSPDGERLESAAPNIASLMISIHAPRMGSDSKFGTFLRKYDEFQSTLPGWGATRNTETPSSTWI